MLPGAEALFLPHYILPYADSGETRCLRDPPCAKPSTISEKPLMTRLSPTVNSRGSLPLLLSNWVPSSRVPV